MQGIGGDSRHGGSTGERGGRTGEHAGDSRPTSVGYGASFEGISALLAMMTSCAAGVTVVNIDNGFGAGFAASRINRL
jgi:hypothetical protein